MRFLLLPFLLLAACQPMVDTRGHVDTQNAKAQLKENMSRDEVMKLLGSPGTRTEFGGETWYYISERKEQIAFLEPEVTDQSVLAVHFDESGFVRSFETYGEKDSAPVPIVGRSTPTEGHKLGVVEQLLGNIGRYNKPQSGIDRGSGNNGRPY